MTNYDYDVVLWDTVGGAYTPESMKKASGGSEKEVVQLAEALASRGFHVLCLNKTETPYGPEGRSAYCNTETGETLYPGHVRWQNVAWAHVALPEPGMTPPRPIRCKMLVIQRYSRIPPSTEILPDRMVVRATDAYGDYYQQSALTHLCVSEWQAKAFREAGFGAVKVIPAMLDDDYYELANVKKVRGRFIYASAAMKGLKETVEKWTSLRKRFPREMEGCELYVTSPGYGKVEMLYPYTVRHLDDLPPRKLAKYMATCEGLFYVNTFPETFCAVAAIAEAVGARPHILAKNGKAGIVDAVSNTLQNLTESDEDFDEFFIRMLGAQPFRHPDLDFRVSTVMSSWIEALHLVVEPDAPVRRMGFDATAAIRASKKEKENTVNDKTPTVCLVMLAKGAETTIARALESVKNFVDKIVIGFDDVESSSDMKAIVDDMFGNKPTIAYRKWINFSENRNELLSTAKEFSPTDYILTLDADDWFTGLNEFDKSSLTLDAYEVDFVDGGLLNSRTMLWKADAKYYYKGPAHEYLTSDPDGRMRATGKLEGVSYNRGYISKSAEETRTKYLRDVRLFISELKKHPGDTRSAYYLAQSLEDAACGDPKLLKDAEKAYLSRSTMTHGFVDERFNAFMKVGRLRRARKATEDEITWAFRGALRTDPRRGVEAMYELANYYNNEGGSKEKSLAACGVGTPSATAPRAFLADPAIYAWKYDFERALALFYTGSKREAGEVFRRLLDVAPADQHDVLRANLAFCGPEAVVEPSLLDELEGAYGNGEVRRAVVAESAAVPDTTPMTVTRESKPVPWFTPKDSKETT